MECWKSSNEFLLKFPKKVSIKFLRNFNYLTIKGLLENNVLLYFRRNFN